MKKMLKDLIPAIIVALVASFMLYIYEPIITYSANINDFWFDFNLMLPNIMLYFIGLFFIFLVGFAIIYYVSLKLKKEKIYKIVLVISFILLTFFYIQGVYLVGSLPTLDGTTIEWGAYTKDTIISICLISAIIIAEIILIKKFNIYKAININKYITIAIFVMISVSVVSSFANPSIFKEKVIATATNRNINNVSSDKNFFILLVDAVDSYDFAKIVKESDKYSDTFNDFTYYPDTLSGYTFTRDSIPFIFSGEWNENKTEFDEYATKAFNESKFLKELKDKEYNMNFYEYQVPWNDKNAACFSNIELYEKKVDGIKFFKELTKYILFKYLPYPLKKYSHIETANFDYCKVDEGESYFNWENKTAYENIKNNELNKENKKYFQFMHIEGGHVPFDYDEDVNEIPVEEGNYNKKMKATLNIINSYIERLKKNNVYDNSVIVIMADHGYWNSNNNGRHNPILYIKGINEHHKMETSEIPISYEDICGAFTELLQDKNAGELFKNIDHNRIRRFIDNPAGREECMTEYEVKGKAWDSYAVVETGRKFNR